MTLLTKCLLHLLSWMPRWMSQRLGLLVGLCHFYGQTASAAVTRENLSLCYSDLNETLVRESLIETGKTMLETPAVWFGARSRIDPWIAESPDLVLLKDKLDDERRGLLILLPHLGNWELFNVLFARFGQMTALYQPPRQTYLQPIMEEIRQKRGNKMVPTNRSGIAALYRTLKQGGTVVVLPDQVPSTGVFAPLFGEPALTDSLTSRLLAKTGAAVLGVALLRREDGRFDAVVREPDSRIFSLVPGESETAVNGLVEMLVAIRPEQYQWEYKRFKRRPAGMPRLYRAGKAPAQH